MQQWFFRIISVHILDAVSGRLLVTDYLKTTFSWLFAVHCAFTINTGARENVQDKLVKMTHPQY